VTHWYERSFGLDYLDLYPNRNDVEAEENVRAIVRLIAPRRDLPTLDLGCGAGRYLCALHHAGFRELSGLDLSEELLAVARKRLAGVEGVALIRADMRDIPYRDRFGTILSLFTSFGYFQEDCENAAVLEAVARALLPEGVFILDFLNKDHLLANLVTEEERQLGTARVRITRRLSQSRRRVEKRTEVWRQQGERQVYEESVRVYAADELEAMLSAAGLSTMRRYGSFAGTPFRADSPRLILVSSRGDRHD